LEFRFKFSFWPNQTIPLAAVTKPGNAVRLHAMNGDEISLMEKIAQEGKRLREVGNGRRDRKR
jgi:hypothetical protein